MQECLCVLAIDDSDEVSSASQEFLDDLFLLSGKNNLEHDVGEIFRRFVLYLILVWALGCDWSVEKEPYQSYILFPKLGWLKSYQKWCLGEKNHLHYLMLSSYL